MSAQTTPPTLTRQDQIIRLEESSLLGSSQKTGLDYVLRLDPDRLLAPCAVALGKTAKAQNYGGWEARQIAGHSLGHYLSALAGFWADTKDPRVKQKLDYTISEIARMQRKDGYFGGVESTPFESAFSGNFTVDNFSLAGYWVPWYNIHKVYSGLIDAYREGGSQDALKIVLKMADWAIAGSADMSDADFQKMLTCEHGGMCEAMADLYDITKDEKYLKMSKRFVHNVIFWSLRDRIDNLQGLHANTQIPKVIGLARLYEVTGEKKYQRAASFFFDTVTQHRSFVIGGNSVGEHFGAPDKEILAEDSCETCNTYNMIKLSEHLFAWTGDSKYTDYAERALYNHILASQDPVTGAKTYFVATKPGHFKVYGTDEDSFWCCTGTGMENPERYNRLVWSRRPDGLYLNTFAASTVSLEDLGLTLKLETRFPYTSEVVLTVVKGEGKNLALKIRKPWWLETPLMAKAFGKDFTTAENGYLTIEGAWKTGDTVTFTLPETLHQYTSADDPFKIAVMYGPLVLAADLGREHFPAADIVPDHLSLMGYTGISVPAIVTEKAKVTDWVHVKDPSKLIFETDPAGTPPGSAILTLKPFYDVHHTRYTIYLRKFGKSDYATYKDAIKTRDDRFGKDTIDTVKVGTQQSEVDHNFQGAQTFSGYIASVDLRWRDARGSGAFFSYDMKFDKNVKNELQVTYFDQDGAQGGPDRRFKILVNDKEIASVTLHGSGKDEAVDVRYPVDAAILEGLKSDKSGKVTAEVRFESDGDAFAGGVLEVRAMKK